MKKTLLALVCVAVAFSNNAQTIIFEDNFDSYTAGLGVAEQSSSWTTWDGSAGYDGEVSADYAFSGANSVKIEGTSTDLVLPIGPYTSGKYDLKFKMLLTDAGGYFNLLHQWAADQTTYQWACDIFMSGAGTVTWTTGGTEGGDATVALNEWFDVMVSADMDADEGRIYINGIMVNQWQWSLNNASGAAGINALVAADFYGTNAANGSGLYYIDDVHLIESTGVGLSEQLQISTFIYPNPAVSQINFVLPAEHGNTNLTISDMFGNIVMQQVVNSRNTTLSLNGVLAGLYIVRIENEVGITTERLVVK